MTLRLSQYSFHNLCFPNSIQADDATFLPSRVFPVLDLFSPRHAGLPFSPFLGALSSCKHGILYPHLTEGWPWSLPGISLGLAPPREPPSGPPQPAPPEGVQGLSPVRLCGPPGPRVHGVSQARAWSGLPPRLASSVAAAPGRAAPAAPLLPASALLPHAPLSQPGQYFWARSPPA